MTARELIALLEADMKRLRPEAKPQWLMLLYPRFMPVAILRVARFCYLHSGLHFLSPIFTWSNVLLFGVEVTPKCAIGPGLFLPHPQGVVIGAQRIGANVSIYQGVTLGATSADMQYVPETRPVIEDGAMIGAGAKVLGGITVGARARVAANSLVLASVAEDTTVIGVPAVVKPR